MRCVLLEEGRVQLARDEPRWTFFIEWCGGLRSTILVFAGIRNWCGWWVGRLLPPSPSLALVLPAVEVETAENSGLSSEQ
jgi:hypothetical protein